MKLASGHTQVISGRTGTGLGILNHVYSAVCTVIIVELYLGTWESTKPVMTVNPKMRQKKKSSYFISLLFYKIADLAQQSNRHALI